MGPAGGETGVPHCLAEVLKLLKSRIVPSLDEIFQKITIPPKICQVKNQKISIGEITPYPYFSHI